MLSSWDEVRLSINDLRERCAKLEGAEGIEKDKEIVMVRKKVEELDHHFSTMREAVDFLKTMPKVDKEMVKVDEGFSDLHKRFISLKREIEKRFLD
jgi:AmiR/NasT family two-component response regulator